MSKTKKALISVFYKDGILDFARYLAGNGWEILSTGGTKKHLQENGVPVTDVASVTGFPECLDGRVKTLHPHIHAGLLAVRDNPAHMAALEQAGIDPIDLVCVNLYPFFEKVQAGLSFAETVEFIDIGGPTMMREAAKNWQDVLVITDPADYPETEAALTASGQNASAVPAELKRRLAGKVFNLTSAYDAAVSRFMLAGEDFPAYFDVPLKKSMTLRYGENGHQKAALYLTADKTGAFGGMEQLQGKELSYNNIRDLDVAWKAVYAFTRHLRNGGEIPGNDFSAYNGILAGKDAAGNPADPCGTPVSVHFSGAAGKVFTIALKHNTPCGAALGGSVLESYRKTYNCDPVSVFGGIIGCSAEIDKAAAEEMIQCFLDPVALIKHDQIKIAHCQFQKSFARIPHPRGRKPRNRCDHHRRGITVPKHLRPGTLRKIGAKEMPAALFERVARFFSENDRRIVFFVHAINQTGRRQILGICCGQTSFFGLRDLVDIFHPLAAADQRTCRDT